LSRSLQLANLADSNDHALAIRGLNDYNSINTTAIYAASQQRTRQIVATTSSSLSLASALIAVYWFFMMRRNFRRDLVLLLILGGSFKSLWFVVFSVYSFVHGVVDTETAFCQANGYLLQVGFEQCGKLDFDDR
jgi:G protein-coupled receptor GPR1